MTGLIFAILLGLIFLLFPSEGNIFLPDRGNTFVVLPGENETIAWKIDPAISLSDVKLREWQYVPTNTLLAEIINNENVTITKNTILGTGFEIIKPSSLVLKNVDKRFNGGYRFRIRVGLSLQRFASDVTVFVAVTPMVSVNCSSFSTLDKGDYFACECKGEGGNPPANVTWYKENESIVTGKEEAILRLPNVDKDNNGTYACEAKSGHEKAKNGTCIELVVYYPPEKTILKFIEIDNKSVTITCEADAHPAPTFEILLNEKFVISNKTYTISYPVNASDVGCYKCVAVHRLGNKSTDCNYLSPEGATTTHLLTISSTIIITTTQDSKTSNKMHDIKACSNDTSYKTEWYIVVVTLVSGIIIGILFSYIVWCSHRRWFRNRRPQSNPEPQRTEVDTTYQELDLSKLNTEDNYQSLRVNAASYVAGNRAGNEDDSTYTELNTARDVENNYQSLT